MTKKLKVALLFGGRSAEHEVSLVSASSIHKNLDKHKYDIRSIYINREGNWRFVESPLLAVERLTEGCFLSFLPWTKNACSISLDADIYFPVLHGPFGEDGTIQGFFEMADVPYVGAAVMASAVGMDKATAKVLFQARNLPLPQYAQFLEEEWKDNRDKILSMIKKDFPLPLFVKPSNLGSSVGITKVKDHAETAKALEAAFLFDRKILVEEGIQGREIECSVLGNTAPKASLPGEVIPFREFYDYRDKYIDGRTTFGIPAELPAGITKEIQRIAIEAFRAIDCSGMARVDFFLQEKTGSIFLSEINTIPGFTEISMYPKLWEVSGLPYPDLLEELIELGLEKHRSKKRNTEGIPS